MGRITIEKSIISLLKKEPMQTIDVAARLGIERHTVVKYLETMESKGIVCHDTLRRAKIWRATTPNIISALKKNDPLIKQFSEILDNVDEHINIQNEKHEVIWKNKFARNDNLKCWNKMPDGSERCENCPVETTFITGKTAFKDKSCHGKHKIIITKPIKDENNKTVAVVEIIKDRK
jgi:Mn-dependent DtxR family transcriptional regulator